MIKIIKKIKINKRGFTLIELLIIISIIGVLSGMITYIISSARAKARDAERVYTLRQFRTALELYYADHGTYLDAYNGSPDGMTWWAPYKYWKYEGGNCSTGFAQVAFDGNAVVIENSISLGFMKELSDLGYISVGEWQDPLAVSPLYNCRYIVPYSEYSAGSIQHYMLHCKLEVSSDWESNDGGLKDDLFEIQGPEYWICVTDE